MTYGQGQGHHIVSELEKQDLWKKRKEEWRQKDYNEVPSDEKDDEMNNQSEDKITACDSDNLNREQPKLETHLGRRYNMRNQPRVSYKY